MNKHIELLTTRYPTLSTCWEEIQEAFIILETSYASGNKLLVVGNGGSAADAEHIVGELMKSFKKKRTVSEAFGEKLKKVDPDMGKTLVSSLQGALPAIALDGHPSLITAYMNDVEPLLCFAQQVNGYGKEGDVLLAISTSGNSENIIYAAVTAKAKGMKIIGLTGEKESRLSSLSDVTIRVPENEVYLVQELHLPIYHTLCLMLEESFFGER